jgi:hypothetical protein
MVMTVLLGIIAPAAVTLLLYNRAEKSQTIELPRHVKGVGKTVGLVMTICQFISSGITVLQGLGVTRQPVPLGGQIRRPMGGLTDARFDD